MMRMLLNSTTSIPNLIDAFEVCTIIVDVAVVITIAIVIATDGLVVMIAPSDTFGDIMCLLLSVLWILEVVLG